MNITRRRLNIYVISFALFPFLGILGGDTTGAFNSRDGNISFICCIP